MKQKAFSINFKGLSMKQITIFLDGESPTLVSTFKFSKKNILHSCYCVFQAIKFFNIYLWQQKCLNQQSHEHILKRKKQQQFPSIISLVISI